MCETDLRFWMQNLGCVSCPRCGKDANRQSWWYNPLRKNLRTFTEEVKESQILQPQEKLDRKDDWIVVRMEQVTL